MVLVSPYIFKYKFALRMFGLLTTRRVYASKIYRIYTKNKRDRKKRREFSNRSITFMLILLVVVKSVQLRARPSAHANPLESIYFHIIYYK